MRHRKSRWDETGTADHDRTVAERGKRAARGVGKELYIRQLVPEVTLSATPTRARSTARQALRSRGCEGGIVDTSIPFSGDTASHIGIVSSVDGRAHIAMLVGRNPMLEDLVALLTSKRLLLPVAAIACIELPVDTWSELKGRATGQLQSAILPKELA